MYQKLILLQQNLYCKLLLQEPIVLLLLHFLVELKIKQLTLNWRHMACPAAVSWTSVSGVYIWPICKLLQRCQMVCGWKLSNWLCSSNWASSQGNTQKRCWWLFSSVSGVCNLPNANIPTGVGGSVAELMDQANLEGYQAKWFCIGWIYAKTPSLVRVVCLD